MNAPCRFDDFKPWQAPVFIRRKGRDLGEQATSHVLSRRNHIESRTVLTDWPVRFRFIAIETCTSYGFALSDIFNRSVVRAIAYIRQVMMWRLHVEKQLSLMAIGRLFGRDHTTVGHAVRKIETERRAA